MSEAKTPIRQNPRPRRRMRGALLGGVAMLALAAPLALSPVLTPQGAPAQARLDEPFKSYADLVDAMKPAVVTIATRQSALGGLAEARPEFPDGPFGDMFRRFFEERGEGFRSAPRSRPARGLGSGFIIDPSGVVITNNHVVENAESVAVIMDDGTEYEATLVGADDKTDIAVLKIETDAPLATAAWADSDAVRVGDPAVAIGNPFGLGGSVTAGIVSARGRDINAGPYDDFLQVDAAINRGNSGGPLFNEFGGVIGVNTAIISPSGGNIGLGFAIPANQARAVAEQILENGFVERGLISVSIQPVTEEIADSLGLPSDEGALVADVTPGGPADRAGVRAGDVITGFAGAAVGEVRDLTRAVAATPPGAERELTVFRRGEAIDLTVTVGRMDGEAPRRAGGFTPRAAEPEMAMGELGLRLGGGRGEGVRIVAVKPLSPAATKGLRPGDVILEVNQERVETPRDVADAVQNARDGGRSAALLMVERDGDQRFVGLPLDG
ncbi:MAG: Do family serine endopeptidase [Pseudomonadota bacterium]